MECAAHTGTFISVVLFPQVERPEVRQSLILAPKRCLKRCESRFGDLNPHCEAMAATVRPVVSTRWITDFSRAFSMAA